MTAFLGLDKLHSGPFDRATSLASQCIGLTRHEFNLHEDVDRFTSMTSISSSLNDYSNVQNLLIVDTHFLGEM